MSDQIKSDIKKVQQYITQALNSTIGVPNKNGRIYAEKTIKKALESIPMVPAAKVVDVSAGEDNTVNVVMHINPDAIQVGSVSVSSRSHKDGIGQKLTDQIMEEVLKENEIPFDIQNCWYVINEIEYCFGSYKPRTISIFRHSDHHEPDFDLTEPDVIQKMVEFLKEQ